MSAPEFNRYPMWMRHPAETPAILSDDYGRGESRPVSCIPGRPLKFPPVMVMDEDQESYYEAQGYGATKGDPAAYLKATIAPPPPSYQHHEYPRFREDGTIDEGPDAPQPPDNYYPLWVRMIGYAPTLVADKDAHQALLTERNVLSERPVSDAEAECMAAILAVADSECPEPAGAEPPPDFLKQAIERATYEATGTVGATVPPRARHNR